MTEVVVTNAAGVAVAAGQIDIDDVSAAVSNATFATGYELDAANSTLAVGPFAEGQTYTIDVKAKQITYAIDWAESQNVVVSNGAAQVEGTSGNFAKDTVLKFYATVGSITNVTVNSAAAEVANPFEYTVGTAAATIKVLAGTAAEPTPVVPGTDIPAADPTAKAAEINALEDKSAYVKAPGSDSFTTPMTDAQKTAYASYFKAVTSGDSAVKMVYDETKDATLKATIDAKLSQIKITSAEDSTIDAVAGFYYRFVGGTDVSTITTAGTAKQAEGNGTVTLTKPDVSATTKAFYKVEVSAEAFK